MDLEITKKDGKVYRLSDYGVVYDVVVRSIESISYKKPIPGRPGTVDYGSDYGVRKITVPMKFKHNTMHDYAALRDEIYAILTGTESYYIREMRRPKMLGYEFVEFGQAPIWSKQTEDRYVNGKRFLVQLVSEIEPEQLYNGGEITLEFETTELPFAESAYTTLQLDSTGYVDTAEKYGGVDGINENMVAYSFTGTSFSVWNAGNVTVEPEFMRLIIKLTNASVTSELRIKNVTTGQTFIYTGSFSSSNFVIDGLKVLRGAYNDLRLTNRQFIKLVPGENRFEITGATYEKASVDFRFYYK